MATVIVPTMSAKVDPNPKGSATAHVTLPSGNPFERQTVAIRSSNQPGTLHAMLPGLGGDIDSGSTKKAPPAPASTSHWNWGGMVEDLVSQVAIPFIGQEIMDRSQNAPATPLQTPTINTMQYPTNTPVPSGNYRPPYQAPPKPSMMPWIIGGAGLLAVGGLFLATRKR